MRELLTVDTKEGDDGMDSNLQTEMQGETITEERIQDFIEELRRKNRSDETLESYRRGLALLYAFLPEKKLDASTWEAWKEELLRQGFQPGSVNQRLSVLNSFLLYLGYRGWCGNDFVPVESRLQPELTRNEYKRLLSAAKMLDKEKAYLLIKVIGGAGISVGDLACLTVEAVQKGSVENRHSHPTLLPEPLREELAAYLQRNGITAGPVFQTISGRPIDRKTVCSMISSVSADAMVDPAKATPKCLLKMYEQTRKDIEEHISILAEQSYLRMLEEEQHTLGWEMS